VSETLLRTATAAMNFSHETISGRRSDGKPTKPPQEGVLREVRVTFMPVCNPYGRTRSPVDWWHGTEYCNEECEYMTTDCPLSGTSAKAVDKFCHVHLVFERNVETLG